MFTTIIINVDELWLKGKNRKSYSDALRKHVRDILSSYLDTKWTIRNDQQRFVCDCEAGFNDDVIKRLCDIPGLHSVLKVRKCEKDLNKAVDLVIADLKLRTDISTFKVQSKRVDKSFPTQSRELNLHFGGAILKNTHLKVDVHNPDITVEVKILNEHIYLSWEKHYGIGGLPVNTSGHVVTLISGGFDSPVASYLMSRRGCKQTFAFFYAYPYVGEEVKDKIVKMCQILSKFQNGAKLYVIPFGNVQNFISNECYEEYRTLFFRKYMMDVASKLADKIKAEAILMGDSLAQVSSQTLHNMAALDKSCDKLVLRPLLGNNKLDIIALSKKIGTHDTSIIPHDDACSLFAPKHPITKPKMEYFNKFINKFPCTELIDECIENAEVFSFNNRLMIKDSNFTKN
ncbi:tRNA uracil 4-sulfurtransferase ThiI [Bacteriovorax sp. Seq25_V]|uniref:tRNA uracil 4-sulfurtransferase ThiI n=1 Tax=Bacteriovorax sp. Seq25_V TaxID=1201288 RepID=UPI00038A1702|nr:tRNA uracil 4-sulfurtransferase ThiI [Bacteriovorax sp. Seq25_V]EQC45357.1 tRNA sulfurtransferase ThiI [Bacteriovorax sp. Seq25_V]